MALDTRYSLKTNPFQFSVFTPKQYQAQPFDISIVERSLERKENRLNQAYQQLGQVDTALSGIEQQLNSADKEWFNNYKNNIKQELQTTIDEGNPGSAIRRGIRLAGDTITDTAVLGRIEANKKYNEWDNTLKQKLAKKEIDQDTYAWAIANNPYKINETFDNNGKTTNVNLVEPNSIYDTLNYQTLLGQAATFNRPDVVQTDFGGGGGNPALYQNKDAEGKLEKLVGEVGAATNSWRNGHQLEEVTVDNLLNTVGDLLNLPDLRNQLFQDYQVSQWKYGQLLANGTLNNADYASLYGKGLVANGAIVPIQEYMLNKVTGLANALAYRKEGTTSLSENSFTFGGRGTITNPQEGEGGSNPNPGQNQVTGSAKQIEVLGQQQLNGAAQNGSNLSEQMNKVIKKNNSLHD